MPTGYTAFILDDELSKPSDFALICARAFGACIEQREDSLSTEIKIPEPDTKYYDENLKKALSKIKRLRKYTKDQKIRFGNKEKNKQIKYFESYIKKTKQAKEKLDKVREWVVGWIPPTCEHEGLKSFMLEQIDSTIKFDGDSTYGENELKAVLTKTPIYYYNKALERAEWDVNYCKEERAKKIDRANQRANWITSLIESLK